MTSWKPIDSAPKDGRTILVWVRRRSDGREEPTFARWWQPANPNGKGFWTTDRKGEPTHWDRAPEGPEGQRDEREYDDETRGG